MSLDAKQPTYKRKKILLETQNANESLVKELELSKKQIYLMMRENARMRVLLQKYMDKDESLLCSSQLSNCSQPKTPVGHLEEETLENIDQTEKELPSSIDIGFDPTEEFSQLSQLSQVSEFGSISQFDDCMRFLENNEKPDDLSSVVPVEAPLQRLEKNVRVGVGVLLLSNMYPGCVLVGERIGSHGGNKIALPGGHLEFGETWNSCGRREVQEETGIIVNDMQFAQATNDYMEQEDKHYITLFLKSIVEGEVQAINMEPEKCKGWKWISWESLIVLNNQNKLFLPLKNLISTGYTPFSKE